MLRVVSADTKNRSIALSLSLPLDATNFSSINAENRV